MKMLLLLLFISSCGGNFTDLIYNKDMPNDPIVTDEQFRQYVDMFEQEFGITVNVPIVFKSIDKSYAGLCLVWDNDYREINISKEYWQYYTEEQREQLIFHELGHCVGNLPHDNTTVGGCPKSIMRSFMFSFFEVQNCYLPNRNEYIVDMYNKINN
jgi:hypothetical protein